MKWILYLSLVSYAGPSFASCSDLAEGATSMGLENLRAGLRPLVRNSREVVHVIEERLQRFENAMEAKNLSARVYTMTDHRARRGDIRLVFSVLEHAGAEFDESKIVYEQRWDVFSEEDGYARLIERAAKISMIDPTKSTKEIEHDVKMIIYGGPGHLLN